MALCSMELYNQQGHWCCFPPKFRYVAAGHDTSATPDNNNNNSDGDQYPEDRGYIPPKQSSATVPDESTINKPAAQVPVSEPLAPILDKPIESVTAKPATQTPLSEPAASGANARTKPNVMETISSPLTPLSPTTNQACSEDEVPWDTSLNPWDPRFQYQPLIKTSG